MATFNIDINFPALGKELKLGIEDKQMFNLLMDQYELAVKKHELVNTEQKKAEAQMKIDDVRVKLFRWMQKAVYVKAYFMCCEARIMELEGMGHDSMTGEAMMGGPIMPEICDKLQKLWKKK